MTNWCYTIISILKMTWATYLFKTPRLFKTIEYISFSRTIGEIYLTYLIPREKHFAKAPTFSYYLVVTNSLECTKSFPQQKLFKNSSSIIQLKPKTFYYKCAQHEFAISKKKKVVTSLGLLLVQFSKQAKVTFDQCCQSCKLHEMWKIRGNVKNCQRLL